MTRRAAPSPSPRPRTWRRASRNTSVALVLLFCASTGVLSRSHASPTHRVAGDLPTGLDTSATVRPGSTAGRVTVPQGADALALGGLFPIAVDVQPPENFASWTARGVNTFLRVPEGHDLEQWARATDEHGVRQIRTSRPHPAADESDPTLLAWFHPDEPDGIHTQVPHAEIQRRYATWKRADPDRPVLINFIGKLNQYDVKTGEAGDEWYRKYVAGADWVSGDIYPVNEQLDLSTVGQMVDRLRAISGGKPVFACIETSDIDPHVGGPGPTAGQLRAEVWSAIIHGARGIFYFPVQFNPWSFDATPRDVAAEMTVQNARITGLASVLQGAINPPGVAASAPAPVQVGWRRSASETYVIALNLSPATLHGHEISISGVSATAATVHDENRTVTIVNGRIRDTFAPYSVHIYKVG